MTYISEKSKLLPPPWPFTVNMGPEGKVDDYLAVK